MERTSQIHRPRMFPCIAQGLATCAAIVAMQFGVAIAQPGPPQGSPFVDGAFDPTPEPPAKPPVVPLSVELNVDVSTAPSVQLGGVDVNALLAEDAVTDLGGKCMRYGLGRDIQVTIGDGQWYELPDGGRLWAVEIQAAAAVGIRLHFADMQLAPGGRVVVYSVTQPDLVAGPYYERGLLGTGEFWSPTRPGERVRVEYHVPALKPGFQPPASPFVIDRMQHIYRDPSQFETREGNCYEDVTCYPAYANLSHACAGIGFINSNALYCSGQLLNTQITDLTPYFITANHCLSSNATAQSSEIFWLFQTSTCNGSPPALSNGPQSNVCTLLSTNSASDYTLLMVEGTIPRNLLYWAGWDSGSQPNGQPVACIHHPGGAYKRISFGTKDSTLACGGADHIRSNWTGLSFTEPGSSGSGLFRQDNQRFIGQLHCGPSYCGAPPDARNDQYGAFSTTYPNISGFLASGSDDGLEDNDSCATARSVGPGVYANLIVKSTDDDWYRINVPGGGGTLSVQLSFTHAFGDIDMVLYDACGGSVVGSSTGTGNTETINFTNNGGTADFLLHVYLYSDTRNTYSMSIAVTAPAPLNDPCGNAFGLYGNNVTVTGSTANATN